MNLTFNENEISIVRNGISIEKNIVDLGLKEYKKDLKEFEKKHKMKTDEFLKKYNNGELGDEEKWFDWLFSYKAFVHLKERGVLIKGMKL